MSSQPASRWWSLITLIIAGESIFFLPFVLTRIFRVTYLDVLGIDNTQLGNCFTAYGIVALVSYLLGGPLSDKFSPRYLMTLALVSTGASGFLLAQVPSYNTLILLYAFWGLSTILLFWSPLLRATRKHSSGVVGILTRDEGRSRLDRAGARSSTRFLEGPRRVGTGARRGGKRA